MFRDALRTYLLLQKSTERKTKMSLYLYINLFTNGTLFCSFDKKVAFSKYFKSLFFAIIITACLFIPWDIFFTQNGIWGFNKQYIVGWYNNYPIFGPRIGTIPLEDTIYNLLLLLLICFFTNHFHTLKKARK